MEIHISTRTLMIMTNHLHNNQGYQTMKWVGGTGKRGREERSGREAEGTACTSVLRREQLLCKNNAGSAETPNSPTWKCMAYELKIL